MVMGLKDACTIFGLKNKKKKLMTSSKAKKEKQIDERHKRTWLYWL